MNGQSARWKVLPSAVTATGCDGMRVVPFDKFPYNGYDVIDPEVQGIGKGGRAVSAAERRAGYHIAESDSRFQQVIAQLGDSKSAGKHQRAEFEQFAAAEAANFFFGDEVNRRSWFRRSWFGQFGDRGGWLLRLGR